MKKGDVPQFFVCLSEENTNSDPQDDPDKSTPVLRRPHRLPVRIATVVLPASRHTPGPGENELGDETLAIFSGNVVGQHWRWGIIMNTTNGC